MGCRQLWEHYHSARKKLVAWFCVISLVVCVHVFVIVIMKWLWICRTSYNFHCVCPKYVCNLWKSKTWFMWISCLISFWYGQGHHGEVWALAVSPNGKSVVTSSHDHSLRLWEKTEELLVLEEEREMVSM